MIVKGSRRTLPDGTYLELTVTLPGNPEDDIPRTPVPWDGPLLGYEYGNEIRERQVKTWAATRLEIFDRDEGVCQVCKEPIHWDYYECGHKVDRCAGGSDEPDNLVAMCNICNRIKPVHDTLAEYEEWAAGGGQGAMFERAIRQYIRITGMKADEAMLENLKRKYPMKLVEPEPAPKPRKAKSVIAKREAAAKRRLKKQAA